MAVCETCNGDGVLWSCTEYGCDDVYACYEMDCPDCGGKE